MLAQHDMETVLIRSSDAAVEPLTAPDVRVFLRDCASDEDDAVVVPLIKAARNYVENVLNRALITQTWKLYLTQWPTQIELRRCPVASVASITYVDTAGDTQTLSTDVYAVDTASEPGLVTLKYNQSWPSIRGDHMGIVVTFTAGYGAAGSSVPENIRHAMRLLVGHWYMNREAVGPGAVAAPLAMAVESLLWSARWGAYS